MLRMSGWWKGPGGGRRLAWIRRTRTVMTGRVEEDTLRTTREFGTVSRSGLRTNVVEQFDRTSVGDRVVK